ncbi:MAG: GTPase Era [Eubacterium sp.]|jgi:GTP-binding protein Era
MKSGFAGIIGRPNVGKSTLLNALLGEKIAIATDKPQTTRNSIRGIYTRGAGEKDGVQIVFIDTPGIHKAHNKLGEAMDRTAIRTFKEVDVILFLVDSAPDKGRGDKFILDMIKDLKTPKILVINKIDEMDPDEFRRTYDEYDSMGIFDSIEGISALKGINVEKLIPEIESHLEEGPMYFPEDMIADVPEKFLASEIIREKLLMYLDEEVPHGVAVVIDKFVEGERLTEIYATIICERESHKGIIIGKGGRKLKGVGKSARLELEALLGTKVYLELHVKVKENWRDSDVVIRNLGYDEKDRR